MKTYLPRYTQVHISALRKALCGNPSKLPRDFTFDGTLPLYQLHRGELELLGEFNIVVTPTRKRMVQPYPGRTDYPPVEAKSSKHRIFARLDGRLVPVGRLSQAMPPHKRTPRAKKTSV